MSLRHFVNASLVAISLLGTGCFDPHYASGDGGFACSTDPTAGQGCPSGQACSAAGQCVDSTGGSSGGQCIDTFTIPKTGNYTGTTLPAMLDNEGECPDQQLEPNDTSCEAVVLPTAKLVVGGSPLDLVKLAICPTGNNPKAGNHDVDVYEINVPSTVNAEVEVTYDVKYGDLDVGIFRQDGTIAASDGSAVSDACVVASLSAGNYLVVVVGANNTAVNNYTMSIRYATSALTCPTSM